MIITVGSGYHARMKKTSDSLRVVSPLRAAFLAQLLGIVLVGMVPLFFPGRLSSVLLAALLQGFCAAIISRTLGAPRWWTPLHLFFLPAAVLLARLELSPGWYLAGFALLLLIYWRTDQSQVPLYLSNAKTAQAVLECLPARPCRIIDLGCGHGGLLRILARARPDCQFVGIEHAPLPWLWAKLASRRDANLEIRHGDFWKISLAEFDVVYAFLSPAPMPRLFQQARAQMQPDALLLSNSFEVPEIKATRLIEVDDRRSTLLHVYQPGLSPLQSPR